MQLHSTRATDYDHLRPKFIMRTTTYVQYAYIYMIRSVLAAASTDEVYSLRYRPRQARYVATGIHERHTQSSIIITTDCYHQEVTRRLPC